jgi:hypothetical protein
LELYEKLVLPEDEDEALVYESWEMIPRSKGKPKEPGKNAVGRVLHRITLAILLHIHSH